ncbi:polyprenyl synthetase family protein [Micromonospora sp. WMMD1076]|uniref:polyprenyl synthetase family protein n=1 Tax=Micromonospora sp. WMMD1076 TaxID=3016103 RepID=UPI00249C37EA|nr:polyprenyl synthetase family protein [Micromonospora sp. WMMD1076]WFF05883.1 polyprenyl synthetase family protein [Micromonospora sp. WMMD1076]
MKLVDEQLYAFLRTERERCSPETPRSAELVDVVAHMVAAGGKRIRPAFCVSGHLAAGGEPGDERVLAAAGALELLHACALIHDDIMDGATRRRGSPTVHHRHADVHRRLGWTGDAHRYGENVAILAGDLALVYADQFIAPASPVVGPLWAQLRSELIVGQFADIVAGAEFAVDLDVARSIAVAKSGRYTIHRPLEMGAVIAGRPDLAAAFAAYGTAVGEAFQLRDDLMDVFGDSSVTGKPHGLDLEQHKMTLLIALAVERDPGIRDLLTADPGDACRLLRRLAETGVRARMEEEIDRLVEQGCRAIADAPLADGWREELTEMAHLVAYRER